MELDLKERFLLLGLLPAKGSYTTIQVVRMMQERLSPSEEEHKEWEIKDADGRIFWKEGIDTTKEIIVGGTAKKIFIEKLIDMDKKEEIGTEHISIYNKFIGESEEDE